MCAERAELINVAKQTTTKACIKAR